MINKIFAIIGLVGLIITIVWVLKIDGKCPDCGGKLIDDDYDESIHKVVWTCTKCKQKWILY